MSSAKISSAMNIRRVWAIYFSPTGTTQRVVSALADTLSISLAGYALWNDGVIPAVHKFDFTLPQARTNQAGFPRLNADDLVIFGCPTYAGRLPNLLLKYLDTIAGGGAMAVPVVTYGNRHFDNSLIELRDILESHDFHTIAAVAAACEHSFSDTLGAGRPDEQDRAQLREFAAAIADKVIGASHLRRAYEIAAQDRPAAVLPPVEVPGVPAAQGHGGYYQPRDRHGVFIDIRKVKPKTDAGRCLRYTSSEGSAGGESAAAVSSGHDLPDGANNAGPAAAPASSICGVCAAVCSMGAIDPEDITQVPGICIKCGACIKKCPERAKYYDDPGYLYHKTELEEMYQRRAENHLFL